MAALQIFLSAFWPVFIGTAVALSLVRFFKRVSASNASPLFTGPKSFPELAAFTKAEQIELLNQAAREAFHGGRWFFPILIFSGVLASGLALGYVLPLVTAFPHSLWAWVSVGVVFGGFGSALVARLERRYLRPVLRKMIETRAPSKSR